MYGIGPSDTIRSYWHVVNAINSHPNIKVEYPKDHEDQQQIALGFQNISSAGFKCCAGVIDGILIWIHEPSKKDCIYFGCNNGKFMWTLKQKIDLIARQYATFRVGFLTFPSCILDLLHIIVLLRGCPFSLIGEWTSCSWSMFFGDNLYLNMPYMATPYAAVSGGTKDAYNYHSQL